MRPNDCPPLPGAIKHRRSAPPDWLVPTSPEVIRHGLEQHTARCGESTLTDAYTCPCHPPCRFAYCGECGDILLIVASSDCPHLLNLVHSGRLDAPVRWVR